MLDRVELEACKRVAGERGTPCSINHYQQQAQKFAFYPKDHISIPYAALALAGEAGELANIVKKMLRDDKGVLTEERRNAILEELGDVLWYAAAVATELRADLGAVAARNILKLQERHADNKPTG